MSSLDFMQLCRLCLVKDGVSMSIFDGEGDVRQIFLKIASCLPVKVAREDKLPKKICDDCVYKVELLYQFWNTTLNADKQLRQWMGELNPEDKQGYVSDVLNTSAMKEVQATENRLDGNVIQHGGEHQNNMAMGMIDNMGLSIPIIMSNANQQQQITSVPMDTSGSSVQTVQALPGPSSQAAHNQISQNQTGTQHEDEDDTEDDENSDEECDGDDGLTVKEESEEEHNNRTVEPTTFVNVPLACDEAGPSGLQQQKISEIPEMSMPQSTDEDPKSESANMRNSCQSVTFETTVLIKEELIIDETKDDPLLITGDLKTLGFGPSVEPVPEQILPERAGPPEEILSLELKRESVQKYKCVKCNKISDELHSFEDHANCESEQRVSTKRAAAPPEEGSSMKREHQEMYECDKCGRIFDNDRAWEKHPKCSRDYKYVCPYCPDVFKRSQELAVHQEDHVRTKCRCLLCGRIFGNKFDLRGHFAALSSERAVCPPYPDQLSTPQCEISLKYKLKSKWRKTEQGENYKVRNYKCPQCPSHFKSLHKIRAHLEQHLMAYECDICTLVFRQKEDLYRHIRGHRPRPRTMARRLRMNQ